MNQDGHSDTGRLERRTRWLLRAYPADYRAGRGEAASSTSKALARPRRAFSLWITALMLLAGALAWLLRRRTRACASTTS